MSNVSLSDLMRELQAGEEARAKVPGLHAENAALIDLVHKAQEHNQELELAIISYKQTIDSLQSKVRSLEVERDDAGFRELEAADALHTMLATMRNVVKDIDNTVRSIDPPAPSLVSQQSLPGDGVPVNVPITNHGGQSATDPTAYASAQGSTFDNAVGTSADTSTNATSLGQSELPPPSVSSTASPKAPASGGAVLASDTVPLPKTEEYRPFGGAADGATPTNTGDYPANKRWFAKPHDMSQEAWVASGGQP